MSDTGITIETNNEAGFKKGMRDLNANISYLSSLILEAENVKENLMKTKKDAITQYCYPEPEITMMRVYVPEHLTRGD